MSGSLRDSRSGQLADWVRAVPWIALGVMVAVIWFLATAVLTDWLLSDLASAVVPCG